MKTRRSKREGRNLLKFNTKTINSLALYVDVAVACIQQRFYEVLSDKKSDKEKEVIVRRGLHTLAR